MLLGESLKTRNRGSGPPQAPEQGCPGGQSRQAQSRTAFLWLYLRFCLFILFFLLPQFLSPVALLSQAI